MCSAHSGSRSVGHDYEFSRPWNASTIIESVNSSFSLANNLTSRNNAKREEAIFSTCFKLESEHAGNIPLPRPHLLGTRRMRSGKREVRGKKVELGLAIGRAREGALPPAPRKKPDLREGEGDVI